MARECCTLHGTATNSISLNFIVSIATSAAGKTEVGENDLPTRPRPPVFGARALLRKGYALLYETEIQSCRGYTRRKPLRTVSRIWAGKRNADDPGGRLRRGHRDRRDIYQ